MKVPQEFSAEKFLKSILCAKSFNREKLEI